MFVGLVKLAARRRELDAAEAGWLAMVREYDRSEQWRADGFLSCAAALRHACKMTHGGAASHVKLAAKLEQLPAVAGAFGEGTLSRQHAHAIADAYTAERADALDGIAATLVAAAQDVNPAELRELVKHATDAIDGDGGAADDAARYARRRLHASKSLDGMLMTDGLHDEEAGEIILTALDAEMVRDHRADALTNICRRDLARGEMTSRGVTAQVTIVADLAAFADHPNLLAAVRRDAARMGQLSRTTLERLTCDGAIARVITDGASEVLDVGRASRTISPALWKALVVRDRHCRAPGCDQPAHRCQAHHIVHWSRGGPTNLENLELVCWHHHRTRHQPAQPRAA